MQEVIVFKTKSTSKLVLDKGYFSILFIEKGNLTLQLGAQEKTLTQGQILISSPISTIKLVHLSSNLEIIGLKYTIDYLKEIKALNDFHQTFSYFQHQYLPIWTLSLEEQERIVNLLIKLKNRKTPLNQHIFAPQLFNLTFTELLLELVEIGSKQDKNIFQNYNRAEYLALQFMILARDSYKEQTQLDYYADRLNVTTKYLSETVKNLTNKTAKEILVDLRIAQARLLLGTSDLSITEIAYELSYDSPSSFSKSFKQVVGISPKAYKEQYI